MQKIKVSSCCPKWDWYRHSPNSAGIWQNTKFTFNETDESCDFWIVYENLVTLQTTLCPPENTIFIAGEPPSVRTYHPKFLAQFAIIITCDPEIKHKNAICSHLSLPWMVGYKPGINNHGRSYDELKQITHLKKEKLLSVICSDKTFTKGHRARLAFVNALKNYFGDKIDVYGRGIKTFEDKWNCIAPYKYHIALENSAFDHYWTEKISDSFLSLSFPIYYGAPNIGHYFPEGSFTKIDITNRQQACTIIEEAIQNKTYETSIALLKEARNRVLDTYNFLPRFAKLCSQKTIPTKKYITIYPQEHFYKSDSLYLKISSKIFSVATQIYNRAKGS